MRIAGWKAALAAWTLLAGVAGAAVAGSDTDALQSAVATANAEWAAAMKTGDAAVIAAPYTDDAVFVLPNGKTLRGRHDIEVLYRDGFTHGLATATRITSRHLERDGDLAYESGDADVTVLRDGVPVTNGGRYLTVWQAQPDGAWKIIRNIVLP